MLVISQSLILSEEEEALPDGVPIFLWENLATFGAVTADSEDTNYPASNLTNPATNLEWRGAADSPLASTVEIAVAISQIDPIDGVGIAGHNFGSTGAAVTILGPAVPDPFEKVLLHFDGADGSTTFTDSNSGGSAHVWTAFGNAQIDTAEFKFGGASGLFDGTGDYISTPDHADFALGGGDWTIDNWFNCTEPSGIGAAIAGQQDSAGTLTTRSFVIRRNSTGLIQALVAVGGVSFVIAGTTIFTDAVNPGWHHVAFVRTGDVLKLFLDGVQEGGDLAITGTVNDSANSLTIGRQGDLTGGEWQGWLDEFRIRVGLAAWTTNFTPPAAPAGDRVELVQSQIPPTDEPLLFLFSEVSLSQLVISIAVGSELPRAAVLYVGKVLRCERSFDVGQEFTPPRFARKTDSVNGMSTRGGFLGRIITGQVLDGSQAVFRHFTPDWYRQYFDPFIAAAQRDTPFFFAWAPDDYQYEVAYGWLTKDPMPQVSPITRRMHVTLDMGGIVE